jgi:oxygen-independent coproporphyrinogen III oxidase
VFADEIEFLRARGLMELGDDALSLTEEGTYVQNGIIPLFAAPSIQGYLVERDPTQADDFVRNRKSALRVARSA